MKIVGVNGLVLVRDNLDLPYVPPGEAEARKEEMDKFKYEVVRACKIDNLLKDDEYIWLPAQAYVLSPIIRTSRGDFRAVPAQTILAVADSDEPVLSVVR